MLKNPHQPMNSISCLVLFIFISFSALGQDIIKTEFTDSIKSSYAFLIENLDSINRVKYEKSINEKSDSLIIFLPGYAKGTKFNLLTDNSKYSFTVFHNYAIMHQVFLDYISVKKDSLINSDSIKIQISFTNNRYPEFNYDCQFILEDVKNEIINSKSLVIFIRTNDKKQEYALLEFDIIDVRIYEKLVKDFLNNY